MGTTGQGPGLDEVNGLSQEARSGVRRLLDGFRPAVVSGVAGAAVAALVVGLILMDVPVIVIGGGVLALLVVLGALGGRRRSAREKPPAGRTALARIEDLRATAGEMADVPVEFKLTVAPRPEDDRPAYRVKFTQHINLADLPAYRPRGIVVVEYRPDEPWNVRVLTRPTEEWSRRAEEAEIDSAPESSSVSDPDGGVGAWCLVVLLGLLAGAAVVVLLFRGELFASEGPAERSSPSSSVSRTFSTSTTVSGPSSSLLTFGRMRMTAWELEARVGSAYVTSLTIEDRRMAVRGDSALPPAEAVHLQSLPYELFPGLVREARTTLGVRAPGSWRIDVSPGAGTEVGPRVRVTVSGPEGTARLDADGTGRITDRRAVGEAG
ncbi:hypothetical protein [Streptomyces sp. bgisy029]|uniref:hypothetical protein n=1 Tax=Streptomyces sp. bgisy029 TaxID=3413771 RepID=UPI003D73DC9A